MWSVLVDDCTLLYVCDIVRQYVLLLIMSLIVVIVASQLPLVGIEDP